jgi:hypothetical protein
MLWNKTYGGAQDDIGVSLIQVSDDGFVITGYTSSFGSGLTDVLLIKTDSDGRLQWQKTYGGSNYYRGANVFQTSDGGFVIVTDMLSYVIGRYGLIKTDTEFGIAQIGSDNNTLTFYRGETDTYWNYIHVRVWKLE